MAGLDITLNPVLRKRTGSHYTPSALASFVAKQILDEWSKKPSKQTLRILDPAVGDGELLFAITEEAVRRGTSKLTLTGFDINPDALDATKELISDHFPDINIDLFEKDFLQFALNNAGAELFDVVIANPPYVRTQVLGAANTQKLSREFNLSGRSDLYHAFLKGIEKILSPNGVVGIIVSNRFMTTKSGEAVRQDLLEKFQIRHVWDFGDTRLFEAAVLPAVLLLRKSVDTQNIETGFTSIYLSNSQRPIDASSIFKALNGQTVSGLKISEGILDHGKTAGATWRVSTKHSDDWLRKVQENTALTFQDLGKVRVGIKTTADKVFIVSNSLSLFTKAPETLRPLITHHIARRYKSADPIKNVVYTHEIRDGKKVPIALSNYPNTASYLNSHRDILSQRTYIRDSGRNWYEIWVPQNPSDWKRPKLVFRDISEEPTFWLDLEGNIVNGDCYWLALDSGLRDDLLWLAVAVANSTFIEEFYDHSFNNKLYSGRRRFITQYVERFPLPNPTSKNSEAIITIAKRLYKLPAQDEARKLEHQLNHYVYAAFGLPSKKVDGSGI